MNTRNNIMTRVALAVLVMAIVGLATTSANAGLIVEEQFIYEPPEANIDGQNGGVGFDGPWVSSISHGRIYWIRSPGLSFSTLPMAGNALSRYGSAGRAQAHRLLSAASQSALTGDGTTIWFSVLFQAPSAHRYASFLFGTGAFTTDGSPELAAASSGFGFTLVAADGTSDGGGNINALAFDGSTTPTVVTSTFNPGTETSLIVGKINWKADGTPDELFLFNVTDLSVQPGEGAAIASITNLDFSQSAFDTIAMWDTNNAITDEIRFGTTFGDVVGNINVDPTLPEVNAGDDMITWSGEPVQLDPNIVDNGTSPLFYAWSADPADGVEFSPIDVPDPTITITKATNNPSTVTLTLAVSDVVHQDPVIDTMTIDVYDDACKAANADGTHEFDSTDLNQDCITDFLDFAWMAAAWLNDYTITEAQPLP